MDFNYRTDIKLITDLSLLQPASIPRYAQTAKLGKYKLNRK